MKRIKFILLILFAFTFNVNAQYDSFWSVNWNMSQASGSTNDFIDDFSTRGFEVEGRYFINPSFAVGGKFSWSVLYSKEAYDTYQIDENTDISSTQRRYLYSTPVMLTAAWFPTEYDIDNKFYPYLSMGLGAIWTEQEIRNGRFANNNKQTSFALNPEIGLIFKINNSFGINLKAGYTWATFDSLGAYEDEKLKEIDPYGMLNFGIGFSFMY